MQNKTTRNIGMICQACWRCGVTLMRWLIIFTISSMEGRCDGSLDQQRVIRLSMGFGRFLMRGGRVPTEREMTEASNLEPVDDLSRFSSWQKVLNGAQASAHKLTAMHSPHDAESRATNFIEGLPACDHLPENNTPTEHVTLLTVVTACNIHTYR